MEDRTTKTSALPGMNITSNQEINAGEKWGRNYWLKWKILHPLQGTLCRLPEILKIELTYKPNGYASQKYNQNLEDNSVLLFLLHHYT